MGVAVIVTSEKNYRYMYLANILRDQIFSGYIRPGEYLPSEHQLCVQYSLSRTSVRKSLEQLADEGLIVKRAGDGTKVNPGLVIPAEPSITLNVLVTTPSYFVDHGAFSIIVDGFKKLYPNVHVRLMKLSTGIDFNEIITRNQESGTRPDIVLAYDSQLGDMDQTLSGFAEMPPTLQDCLATVYPRLQDAFRFNTVTKIAPLTFSPVFLAYNPDLFERANLAMPHPEWTRDEFLQACQALKADTNGDRIPDQFGFLMSNNIRRWLVMALQNGIVGADPDSQLGIVRDTFTVIHELLFGSKSALIFENDIVNAMQYHPFATGNIAMTLATTYQLAAWNAEQLRFVPQIGALPFGPLKSTLLISNFLMIPESSPNPELASAFVQTALSPEVQKALSSKTDFLSVIPEINAELKTRSQLEILNITEAGMAHNYHLHELLPEPQVVEDIYMEMIHFWLGLESAASVTRKWQKIVGRIEKKQPPV